MTDREVRIELEAQARTVTVRRDQIPPEDGGAPMPRPAPFASAGGATPAHAGMRTPAYPTATPKHWVLLLLLLLSYSALVPQDSFVYVLLTGHRSRLLCPTHGVLLFLYPSSRSVDS